MKCPSPPPPFPRFCGEGKGLIRWAADKRPLAPLSFSLLLSSHKNSSIEGRRNSPMTVPPVKRYPFGDRCLHRVGRGQPAKQDL